MMLDCYITFRSVTRAQRAKQVLETAQIPVRLTRAPKALSEQGCAYAVLVQEKDAARAERVLKQREVPFEHIMQRNANGKMEAWRR